MSGKNYRIKILSFLLILFIINIYSLNNNHYCRNISNNNRNLKESEEEILYLIKFNFTTKHNINESEDPITYLILNDIRIPIELGTPFQTINASLRFNDYPFFISSPLIKLQNESEFNNIFRKNYSSSYKYILSDSLFYKSQLSKAEKANETFYFSNHTITAYNFSFYYATSMHYNQSGGVVGLCLEDSNMNLHPGMNFLTQLKSKNIISYKTFFINYNKNNENGELIIGAYPHEYSKEKYKYEDFHDITGYMDVTYKYYGFIFDEINIGKNKISLNITRINEGNKWLMTADLRIEFGFILAPSKLEENITKEFIDLYRCNAYIADFTKIYGNKFFTGENFKYYVCDNEYTSNSKISFLSREMEYIFELDKNDLFMKYRNKNYFNIIFSSGYGSKSWIFGKPIFLKYLWVFNPENKKFGFYEKKNQNEKKNFKLIIILIITIVIFLIVLSIFIYEFFIKKYRKIRKNEILDNYDYENNEEKIINPDEN